MSEYWDGKLDLGIKVGIDPNEPVYVKQCDKLDVTAWEGFIAKSAARSIAGVAAWLPSKPLEFGLDRAPIRTDCACGRPGMRRNAEGEPLCDGCTAWATHCKCGQELRGWVLFCGDCRAESARGTRPASLDQRIREASADPTSDWSAWAHPSSEGEKW